MNLMCPARLVLLPLGGATWADQLTGERVSVVYAGAEVGGAAELAERLGAMLSVLPDAVRDLQAIADLHRGETVVVVGPEVGVDLPAVVEHTGDDWSVVSSLDANTVTLAAYEQRAESFASTIPRAPNENLIRLVDEALPAGGDVLELGSGTGRDAAELERRGHRVRRTDATLAFLEMMRADGFSADRLNALTDDYGGPYDVVFADAVFLHFTPDQLSTVLTKCAKAAPLLAFSTREGDGVEWSDRSLELPRHFRCWQEEPLRVLLAQTGWQVLQVRRGQTRSGGWLHVLAEVVDA
ncbi:hypothetical protein Kfla_5010 [Kribbella flavida DSM 17836]|uniref:Methyltransferase type 12 n=1 Tax=Kribbella flavida (strain DSM 17836 / JCM 10339 / NBRC 14399) TaxID=479435 RepID=D2Q280_KRIFD|nr:methyltransferase domain-containing protein [Kribbella flavida]ADB34026.1 hypothetical protein Kfla_5010 [Kribbella flavida DSM 17836]